MVHQEVSSGRIGAHAAQKYLAPLARANRTDAEALCKAIAPLKLHSRQVGVLYAGYAHADDRGRNLILNQPALYLRTQAVSEGPYDAAVPPDPLQQLFSDAETLMAVAKRLGKLLAPETFARLCQRDPGEVKPCVTALRVAAEALLGVLSQEPCHA